MPKAKLFGRFLVEFLSEIDDQELKRKQAYFSSFYCVVTLNCSKINDFRMSKILGEIVPEKNERVFDWF